MARKKSVNKTMKEEEKKGSKIKKNRKNQSYWYVGFAVLLVILFFLSNSFFSNLRGFDYEGLSFTKEMFGDIPVFHHYYYIDAETKYNFYLRIDPRKNNVPIEGEIEFDTSGKFNYISVNANGLGQCEYTSAAVGSLSAFLTNNNIKVRGAMPDLIQAERNDVDFADCYSPKDRYVILIEEGEETRIHREDMCYIIEVANCEILNAIEKFETKALLDAKARANP